MAQPAGWNPFCTQAQLEHWLTANPLVQELYSANNSYAPLNNPQDLAIYQHYYLLARGECRDKRRAAVEKASVVLASANVLMPYMNGKQLQQHEANRAIRKFILAWACYEIGNTTYYEITDEQYTAWRVDHLMFPEGLDGFSPEGYATMLADQNITGPQTVALLNLAVNHAKPKLQVESTRLACSLLISLSRRGTISNEKCQSINGAFKDDGLPDPRITPDLISELFSSLGGYLTGANAAQTFNYLNTILAGCTLRMRLTIQQARGGGLTSLMCVRDAITKFTSFPWGEVAHYLSQDCENYVAASALVGNNSYYGFNSDLGVVRSTKYKSLAYVSIKLLIKYGGPEYTGLANYGGVTRSPLHKDILDRLINEYNPAAEMEEFHGGIAAENVADSLRDAANRNRDL